MELNIQQILNRVSTLEMMGRNMIQEAAMLRKDLSAGGQPVGLPKGNKRNEAIEKAAIAAYEKSKVKKQIKKHLL